ncbi:hypothetical protein THAOC_28463 [Thalassiosira oceanica]|uniref:Uncharacterized protein n=1 Tax=Thalassiosira oceanica TaxID=159749 RepID=K0S092_THAOC|nr:hypothetical protein THAOC_28463 [Thalassiosira oceanica]|eukprot:EJK52282.1 hypothetical protein THAOC_28463 [Thalassiosira oceanica]
MSLPIQEPGHGTSDALPDPPLQAHNTTTDDAEYRITQFDQSMEMTLNDELNEFLQINFKYLHHSPLDGRIQAAQHTTDPECEFNDCNVPTAELLPQLSQPAFTLHHPTYTPGDPPDPELPRAEPSHQSLHSFPAGLALPKISCVTVAIASIQHSQPTRIITTRLAPRPSVQSRNGPAARSRTMMAIMTMYLHLLPELQNPLPATASPKSEGHNKLTP